MGENVSFASNGGKTAAYLATPKSGKGPGVVVIQEWWGLVPHIRELADRFAAEGFVALAPDLYHGRSTESPDEAGRLMMALDVATAERDLAGAVTFLRSRAGGSKVGVVGFCMGGQLALFAAAKNAAIGAAVDFYGIHPAVKVDAKEVKAPVLGFFGAKDEYVTPADAKKLEESLTAAGRKVEVHVYPDAGHAFFNDSRQEAYVENRAKEAWQRMLAFFREHLA